MISGVLSFNLGIKIAHDITMQQCSWVHVDNALTSTTEHAIKHVIGRSSPSYVILFLYDVFIFNYF